LPNRVSTPEPTPDPRTLGTRNLGTLSCNDPPMSDHRFTVGVEEEFQIVDPNTWGLRSHVTELLASGTPALGEHIKRELHQSIVEVGTKICGDVSELRDEIFHIR